MKKTTCILFPATLGVVLISAALPARYSAEAPVLGRGQESPSGLLAEAAGPAGTVVPTVSAAIQTNAAASGSDSAVPASRGFELGRFIGLVVPAAQMTVRAQIDGILVDSLPSVGTRLSEGDVVARMDDSELVLECQRQKARMAAAKYRIAEGNAQLAFLRQKGKKLEEMKRQEVVSWTEAEENRFQVEAAVQRVSALEQEFVEQESQYQLLEHRAQMYECSASIAGQVVEVSRDARQFVRAGETIARIESARRHVTLNLPADMVDRIQTLAFVCRERRQPHPVSLQVAEIRPNYNLSGARTVALQVPEQSQLIPGQTVEVQVISQSGEEQR